MNNCLPWDITATEADGGNTAPGAGTRVVRPIVVGMLLTAAALDLTRCGLVMAAARHLAPTAGLVTAGLAAAALTARTARGCRAGQARARWAALLIGVASSPQAAASGFRSPYMIPDTATAALGILLAITILATTGRMGRQDTLPKPSRRERVRTLTAGNRTLDDSSRPAWPVSCTGSWRCGRYRRSGPG